MLREIQLTSQQQPAAASWISAKLTSFYFFFFFLLAHPFLTRWQTHVCGGSHPLHPETGAGQTNSGLHLLVATWKCSSNYQVLPPSWQSRATSCQFACFLFFCGALDTLVCSSAKRHSIRLSSFSFSHFSFSELATLLASLGLARGAYAQYFWGQMSLAMRAHCQQTWRIIRVNKLKAT